MYLTGVRRAEMAICAYLPDYTGGMTGQVLGSSTLP
jgi:hypothetical protein